MKAGGGSGEGRVHRHGARMDKVPGAGANQVIGDIQNSFLSGREKHKS